MRIKYNKTLTLRRNLQDTWYITSDRNDRYECFVIDNIKTPWTRWWEMQNQSDLREWQKDIITQFASKYSDMKPYVIYKRNSGHSQPHDLALARSERNRVWILSTERDFWFMPCDYGEVIFDVELSMGTVMDRDSRLEMGRLRDLLEDEPCR